MAYRDEGIFEDLFGHEGPSLEWQGYQIKDESVEDVTVKEEPIDFNINEIGIEGHSKQNSTLTEKSDLDKNKSLTGDEQPESNSAFSTNYVGDLFCIKNEENHKIVQKKKFKCSACTYETSVKYNLKIHFRRIHTGEKPFKCRECSYSAAENSSLKKHTRTHTGDKPFKCGDCSFSAARKPDLTAHLRIHTGDKPFKCRDCSFSASRKPDLTAHFRLHTGERPFMCGECSFSATRSSNLTAHLRIHTGEKPFKCGDCSFSAAKSSDLKRHLKRKAKKRQQRSVD